MAFMQKTKNKKQALFAQKGLEIKELTAPTATAIKYRPGRSVCDLSMSMVLFKFGGRTKFLSLAAEPKMRSKKK